MAWQGISDDSVVPVAGAGHSRRLMALQHWQGHGCCSNNCLGQVVTWMACIENKAAGAASVVGCRCV